MKSFEQQYPHIASWVQDGWIEMGRTGYYDNSFLRVLDEGGQIWSSDADFDTLDEALAATDRAIYDWCRANIPDLIVGSHKAKSFSLVEGQYLAFIYNYSQILGQSPSLEDMQRHFGVAGAEVEGVLSELERNGFISHTAGQLRSIKVLVPPQLLPALL